MKLIFFGSGPFAIESFGALSESRHQVLAAVTPPGRPRGRGLKITELPLKTRARERGIPVLEPADANAPANLAAFRRLGADIFAVVSFGAVFSDAFLEIPPHGCVNVHASLLPKYRGASPVAAALLAGERETGVTIIQLARRLDAGDILAREPLALSGEENAKEVTERLAEIGAALLIRTLDRIESGEAKPEKQEEARATAAPKLRKEDGWIDWAAGAQEIHNRVRAFYVWPGSRARLEGKDFTIMRTKPAPGAPKAPPGTIVEPRHPDGIGVACGEGVLFIREIKPGGGKALAHREFLNGHPLRAGQRFEAATPLSRHASHGRGQPCRGQAAP